MPKKELALKNAVILSTYLLIVWGLYRFLFKLPDEVEELFVKPIFWLVPVFYLLSKEKAKISSLGVTLKNLFPAIYFALGLGAFFVIEAIFINFIKYKGLYLQQSLACFGGRVDGQYFKFPGLGTCPCADNFFCLEVGYPSGPNISIINNYLWNWFSLCFCQNKKHFLLNSAPCPLGLANYFVQINKTRRSLD